MAMIEKSVKKMKESDDEKCLGLLLFTNGSESGRQMQLNDREYKVRGRREKVSKRREENPSWIRTQHLHV